MSAPRLSVVVAGGGTAGHIEPALAVADALSSGYDDVTVTALGTCRGLEVDLVPERGYRLELIPPVPVPRKINLDLLKLPWRVLLSVRATMAVLRRTQANVLIGFGGYVAAPSYIAAFALRIPFFVHEANARAGLANKLGVFLGGIGLNAVQESGLKGDVVGVPTRILPTEEYATLTQQDARRRFGLDPQRPTMLLTGGSQGARSLNTALAGALDDILAAGIQVLHAYGRKNTPCAPREGYVALPYISRMHEAYAAADVICCRAGAMTVAEVTASATPAIYVPLPHGNGEQGLNAQPVVDAGAAVLVNDRDLSPRRLVDMVTSIVTNSRRHQTMVAAAHASGHGHAAEEIARRIIALEVARGIIVKPRR